MFPADSYHRLSRINTVWSLVWRAHHDSAEAAQAARKQLLDRYGGAVYRYLRKVLRDSDAADEVFQEFALNLLNGDLRGANPEHGRFRNFVKGTLFHLVADFRKQQQRRPKVLPKNGAALAAAESDGFESDRVFVESWCDELLARAWTALAELEKQTGQPYYAVLKYRAEHPEARSPEMAEWLSERRGGSFSAANLRQLLHRARERFADLLLTQVTDALAEPTPERLEQELIELGLFEYCRPALERAHSPGDSEKLVSVSD